MGHTPGPWEAHPFGDNCYEILAGDNTVCDVPQDPSSPGRSEHDAQLIAAAPKLLSLLRRMVQYVNEYPTGGYHMNDVLRECLAAIAKAEGRSE